MGAAPVPPTLDPQPRPDLCFRAMTDADVPLGMRLKTQAGWNQCDADWRRFLQLAPEGCFVAEVDGAPAGTVVAVVFGPVAWIGMVLVDEAQRGKGIGSALMRHVLAHLDAQPGITSVRLDATHLGAPIYRKLGFEDQFELIRMQRDAHANGDTETSSPPEAPCRIAQAMPDDLDAMHALDQAATETDRRSLLDILLREQPDFAWCAREESRVTAYLLARPGSGATQIGPAIAPDTLTAKALLDAALNRFTDQPLFLDVPSDNSDVLEHLHALGFIEQRRFTRMTRGRPIYEHVPHLLASSGPEKG